MDTKMNPLENTLKVLEAQYEKAKNCGGCKARREKLAKQVADLKKRLGLDG